MLRSTQERRLERLQRRIEEFRAWRNGRQSKFPTGSSRQATATPPVAPRRFLARYRDSGQSERNGPDPIRLGGSPVELELWLGGEGFVRLSTGYQAGLNPMHHRFPVVEQAAGGEMITIDVEAVPKGIFGTNIPEPRLERALLSSRSGKYVALERDLTMLLEVSQQLSGHEVVPFLLDAAEAALVGACRCLAHCDRHRSHSIRAWL